MPLTHAIQNLADVPTRSKGPSVELRRFAAGMRVIIALLCTALIFTQASDVDFLTLAVLLTYGMWSAWLLWLEASGRTRRSALWSYWIDVAWSCLIMKLWSSVAMMMIITLVYPVALATIGYGTGQGLLLAVFALLLTAGPLVDNGSDLLRRLGWREYLQVLLVLSLIPAAALIARPMGLRLRWLGMLGKLEAQLDSRRGLDSTCSDLVEHLLTATQADVVVLVLPSSLGAPAMIVSREDGSFGATAPVHARLESLLSQTPDCPIKYVTRRWWDPRPRTRLQAALPVPDGLSAHLADLATTLDVHSLYIVPLTRYARQHGHFLAGYRGQRSGVYDIAALAETAPELVRIIERATLVDQLQEECAAHERARIGRDLHDSAIQPYIGLKYAVESVALRIPPDNPARAEVDLLAELVNGEISALRELISGLRSGNGHCDNTLVPAVRRQVRRFSALFGIDIEFTCPDTLPTTRAMASSLFHMVNEALNNIRKHTAARRVWINLSVRDSSIHLVIRDDAGSLNGSRLDDFHPVSLRERTDELMGTCNISHPDGLNTELAIQIPVL
jgi:signal transduction histidine kinase